MIAFIGDIFDHGIDVGMAGFWIVWSAAVAIKRILGARTLRTFFQRVLMGAQRIAATVVMAVILVAVWRGGVGFLGAPLFVAVAVLLWWTLKTGEAQIDRHDRLAFVALNLDQVRRPPAPSHRCLRNA